MSSTTHTAARSARRKRAARNRSEDDSAAIAEFDAAQAAGAVLDRQRARERALSGRRVHLCESCGEPFAAHRPTARPLCPSHRPRVDQT